VPATSVPAFPVGRPAPAIGVYTRCRLHAALRVGSGEERDIARTSPPELSDLPADFWDEAVVVAPVIKQAISLRVDPDVLEWFRAQGPRYQSRMNAVLRAYMSRMRKGKGGKRKS
jgi:uncharacterized protein (DUF4415 family)